MSISVPPETRLRVLVLGNVVRWPLGGLAWHYLQYPIGLAALGHDVWFVEDSENYESCYDPLLETVGTDPTYGLRFAAAAFSRIGLPDRWAYFDEPMNRWFGPAASSVVEVCRSADVLLNVSGLNPIRSWMEGVPARALIDTDPAFSQVKHLTDPAARARAQTHTHFFTYGGNIGRDGCTVPDDGFEWRPTRQPVVLDAWPVSPGPQRAPFTTVMQWDGDSAAYFGESVYGTRSASFDSYLDLPERSAERFELAVGSASAPRGLLTGKGWRIRDPRQPTRDPWAYQEYLRSSKGEFAVATAGYVTSRSGWFSERTCGYLASGRPAVVQDTGFSDWLPTGSGVVGFASPEEAIAGIEEVSRDYDRHCGAAREVVEVHFDARDVLTRLLDETSAEPGRVSATGEEA